MANNFFSVYHVSWHRLDDSNNGTTVYTPVVCVNVEKFTVTYENHDYDEISIPKACIKAKDFFRVNFGCKFEGDVNQATGNRVYRHDDPSAPCTHVLRIETTPFSLLYKQP